MTAPMILTLTGPVVLDLGRGVKLRVEPFVDAAPTGPTPVQSVAVPAVRDKMATLTGFGPSAPQHWNKAPSGGSPDVQWFRAAWCEPQGHRHTTITEMGCLIQALAALRGEDPALRERLLAARAVGAAAVGVTAPEPGPKRPRP